MCYMVYISTDCADDLSLQRSELVRFAEPSAATCAPYTRILKHEHKWFVGSRSECSCTFRHLCRESVGLGFGAPEDWFPEDQDSIEATHQLYKILRAIVLRGHQVELLDCWSGDEDRDAEPLDVPLSQISLEQFRLFEGHVFTLRP
jgi:hypothetical protein